MAFTLRLISATGPHTSANGSYYASGAVHYVYRYNVLCVPVAAVLTLQLSVCGELVSDVPLNALFATLLRRAGCVGDPLGSPASRALAIIRSIQAFNNDHKGPTIPVQYY